MKTIAKLDNGNHASYYNGRNGEIKMCFTPHNDFMKGMKILNPKNEYSSIDHFKSDVAKVCYDLNISVEFIK